jgi:hypothetical protein
LAGATPGIHFPISRFYIRRVRLPKRSELIAPLRAAGYQVEASYDDPENTMVVAFPVDVGPGVRSLSSVSMWEQLALAAFLQVSSLSLSLSLSPSFFSFFLSFHLITSISPLFTPHHYSN